MNEREIRRMMKEQRERRERAEKEKLIPKKPKKITIHRCPHCNELIYSKIEKCKCGQVLDWSDEPTE